VLYFVADDGVHGEELWMSDGTPEGTTMLRDIWPGPDGSAGANLARIGDDLYLRADDGVHGRELWHVYTAGPSTDADGDGIPDLVEGDTDPDGDGIPSYADLDSDNDGLPDAFEGGADIDGDGVINAQDLDSDGDGLYDVVERAFGMDPYDPLDATAVPIVIWPLVILAAAAGLFALLRNTAPSSKRCKPHKS
jgi:ELWxxDGT repeat protein